MAAIQGLQEVEERGPDVEFVHVRAHGRDPSQPPEFTEGNHIVDAAAREVAKEWQKEFLQSLDFHLTNAVACQSSVVAIVAARQRLNNTLQGEWFDDNHELRQRPWLSIFETGPATLACTCKPAKTLERRHFSAKGAKVFFNSEPLPP